jgi:hypothetical protein
MVFQGTQGEPTKLDELTVERDIDAGSISGSLAGGGKIKRLLGGGLRNNNQELTINPGAGLSLTNNDLDVTASFSGISGISNPLTADLNADGFDVNNLRRLGVEELSNDAPITINQTQIDDQLIPSGEIVTGPQSTSLNAKASVLNEAPVNSDATAGTESVIKLLESGIDPTMTVSRTLDGQGGAYRHQLDVPTGLVTDINANLSLQHDTLSATNWKIVETGGTNTFNLNGKTRRLRIEHDGTSSSDEYVGAIASPIVSVDSIGSFRLTFQNVEFSNTNENNKLRFGLTDGNITDDVFFSNPNNALFVGTRSIGDRILTVDSGSRDNASSSTQFDFSADDISIEYDGSTISLLENGQLIQSLSYSVDSDFQVFVQLLNDSNNTDGEFVEFGKVTVEPIGGI